MSVPTEADWGDYQSDLDQKYAHDLFAGHTHEEMQLHFYRCVIERADELRWMPKIPFRYYMLGFRDYVMAGKFPEFDVIDAAIRYVGQNQSRLGATESICGNFREKLVTIEARYVHLQEYLKP
jgi:hypothetical protein